MRNKITIKQISGLLAFLLIAFNVQADEPPSWMSFNVESSNKSFIASIDTVDERASINPWERNYTISVREKVTNKLLWRCDYKYDGYSEGILSNDGSTFIYVNEWYYEDYSIISIYQNGTLKKQIKGSELKIDHSKLVTTTSHRLWLDSGKKYSIIKNEQLFALKIYTIDNQEIIINLRTFEIT